MRLAYTLYFIGILCNSNQGEIIDHGFNQICLNSLTCRHNWEKICGIRPHKEDRPVWFRDSCTMLEYNCKHRIDYQVINRSKCIILEENKDCYCAGLGSLCKEHTTRNSETRIHKYRASFEALDSLEVAPAQETNMAAVKTIAVILFVLYSLVAGHGPPADRDTEDISMGRKVKKTSAKWCSMAKVCNHDRVPVCGVSHAGDVMGFRDLCDMFDYNCIRRRNYKQTNCPADKNFLTASRKPTNPYYDD